MKASLAPVPIIVLALACSPQTRSLPAPTQAPDAYDALLMRLWARDTSINFTMLRMSYAASPTYAPYGADAHSHRDSLNAALGRQDYARVVFHADSILGIDYLDVRTHVLRAYAAEQLGDTSAAAWDRIVAARLVQSIMQSGLGTLDSPYVVVTIAEEYAVLGMTGFERGMQSLSECGGRPCDILDATHLDTQEKRTFHFDISLPIAYMHRQFQGKH